MTAQARMELIEASEQLPTLNLAALIAERALSDPTYRIDYTHPDILPALAEELGDDERLIVATPTVYSRGSIIGHKVLRVSAADGPLADVIPFPSR